VKLGANLALLLERMAARWRLRITRVRAEHGPCRCRISMARALLLSLLVHGALFLPWRWPVHPQVLPLPPLPPVVVRIVEPTQPPPPAQVPPSPSRPATPATARLPESVEPVPAKQPGEKASEARAESKTEEPEPEPEPKSPLASRPQPLLAVQAPNYPREAMQAGIEACVLARVHVNVHGAVTEVEIVETDVPGVFEDAVRQAYDRAQYLPAQRDGRPVASRILGVVTFQLQSRPPLNCEWRYLETARRLNAEEAAR
jgi:protein TonB